MLRLARWLVLIVPMAVHAAEPKVPDLPVESDRLPNGLKVALHRDPTVPRVTVCVAYHVGSKDERAGRTGFAHFFEHMMFRGTRNVPNFDVPLQEAGAQSNAFTSEDMTVYYETVPSDYLERALYLEAERLAFLPSALDQAKFDTEREVVKNERRQSYENLPYGLAAETLLAHVFPKGHPYSWSVIGSMKDLDRATTDDLKRFFAEFYHPGNATLCLAGDFDPAEARRLIATYFGPLAPGPARKGVDLPRQRIEAASLIETDRVQLPRIYWSWPTVADDHPDAPALDLLADILAEGEASRLHRALVRDAQVAKDVGAESDAKEIAGLFTVQATAAEGKTIGEIEPIIAKEIDRARAEPPTAEELARGLAKFEKATYTSLTSPLGRAITLAIGFAQKDDPTYYRRDMARYYRVTPNDLKRVAETYLTPGKVTLLIRPAGPDQPESEAVQAGPIDSENAVEPPADRTPRAGPDWSKLPGPSKPLPFHAPKVVRARLSNGLDVWIAPWRTLPIVNARLLIHAGTADDPPGKSGLAHLTATLLDKGTTDKTATELAEALETLGVTLNVGTTADTTSIGFSALARNLDPTLTLVGQVLTSPRFDPDDVDRERRLQLADLLQGPDSPTWIARRALPPLLYGPNHPYGNPAEGFPETVKGLKVEDVRDFQESRYSARGAILIVVGDVEPDALVATLESTLGRWKASGEEPKPRPMAEIKERPGVVHLVDKPGAVQSVISLGRRWVDRGDPRYFATLIGNRILGDDFLSRLNRNLRETNGFTYGAGSYFNFRRTGSVWLVSTSVRADATAPALKEVLTELDALAEARPFTAEEIETARAAESRSFPETFEAPTGIVDILQQMALFRLPPDYLDTFLARLQSADAPTVSRAMTAVVEPSSRVILIVGDSKLVAPQLKALGFDRIEVVTPDGRPVPPK